MKIIVQIPAFNEEGQIKETLSEIPREIDGHPVEVLLINDGSTDNTLSVAKDCGVDHILDIKVNQGLANAFTSGLEKSLELGADIIVNTDADNQYPGEEIPNIVRCLIENDADMVVGERNITRSFPGRPFKQFFQKFGSWVVRKLSNTNVKDAPSGFRAFSRNYAGSIQVFGRYSYTMETLIQAGLNHAKVLGIPIKSNITERPSRLMKNSLFYVFKSGHAILVYTFYYAPTSVFMAFGLTTFSIANILLLRFFYYYLILPQSGKTQSLIIASILYALTFSTFIMYGLAHVLSNNRKILLSINKKLIDFSNENH